MPHANTDEVPRIAVDEFDMADALGLTVFALRKDQKADRKLPFCRIGGRVIYDLEAVKRRLTELQGAACASPSKDAFSSTGREPRT